MLIRGQDPSRFKLTLQDCLDKHGIYSQPFGPSGAVQVFSRFPESAARKASWDLHHLADYVVSSHSSGPSLILVPVDPVDPDGAS